MIKVRVTVIDDQENPVVEEVVEFNEVNLSHSDGSFSMVHRDAMIGAPQSLWERVAFAANVIAERGIDVLLEAMQKDDFTKSAGSDLWFPSEAIEPAWLLLQRLRTGWRPRPDEIDPLIPQKRFISWDFVPSRRASKPTLRLWGPLVGGDPNEGWMTREILWISEDLTIAFARDGVYWL